MNESKKVGNYVIAIDGPCATGKSTISKELAKVLNITYIDTGAMYRAVGLYFYQKNIELNEKNVNDNINDIHIDIYYESGIMKIMLNNVDVSDKIRENVISKMASDVSKYPLVREKLVDMQRKMGQNKAVVLDGRDIGTVVFPNADIKIYLTASADVRALRRQKDLVKKGEVIDIEKVKKELEQRDYNDTHRKYSPLKKADDAIEIDNSNMSQDEALKYVLTLIKEKIGNV